jgi:hypothetical protein
MTFNSSIELVSFVQLILETCAALVCQLDLLEEALELIDCSLYFLPATLDAIKRLFWSWAPGKVV